MPGYRQLDRIASPPQRAPFPQEITAPLSNFDSRSGACSRPMGSRFPPTRQSPRHEPAGFRENPHRRPSALLGTQQLPRRLAPRNSLRSPVPPADGETLIPIESPSPLLQLATLHTNTHFHCSCVQWSGSDHVRATGVLDHPTLGGSGSYQGMSGHHERATRSRPTAHHWAKGHHPYLASTADLRVMSGYGRHAGTRYSPPM